MTPEAHTQLYDAGDCEPIVLDDLSFYVHVSLHPLGQSSLGRQAMGVRTEKHSTGEWEPGCFMARFLNTRRTKYEVQKSTERGEQNGNKESGSKGSEEGSKESSQDRRKNEEVDMYSSPLPSPGQGRRALPLDTPPHKTPTIETTGEGRPFLSALSVNISTFCTPNADVRRP